MSKSILYWRSRAWSIWISTLIILILCLQLFTSGSWGEDIEEPQISIIFDREKISILPSSVDETRISLNVTIECSYPQAVPINAKIALDLKMKASWWNVSSAPSIEFDLQSNIETFEVIIMVPPNSSADDEVLFEVWGSWRYVNGGGSAGLEKTSIPIDIQPFFDLFMGSNEPVKYSDVGDWTSFAFNITNRANTDAEIELDLICDRKVIEYQLEKEIHLSKGETVTLNLSVKQKPSASRRNTLHVVASFKDDPEELKYDLELELNTEPTLSTFFYERNFIFLISVIALITLVAASLFIFEKTKGPKEEDPELMDEIEESSI